MTLVVAVFQQQLAPYAAVLLAASRDVSLARGWSCSANTAQSREGCQCNEACHGRLPLAVPVPESTATSAIFPRPQCDKGKSEAKKKKRHLPRTGPDLWRLCLVASSVFVGVVLFSVMRRTRKRNRGGTFLKSELADNAPLSFGYAADAISSEKQTGG